MNYKNTAFKISLASICLILAMAIVLNIFSVGADETALQFAGLILSLLFVIPAIYIWIDGFHRFKPTIGNYGGKWLLYITFNVFAGLYLHYVYSKNDQAC